MKICVHKGLMVAILTRNEHCPPHVHVGNAEWDARFQFSFWHDSVHLWDVTPAQNAPKAALLEELRQAIKQSGTLRNARECWWDSRQTICLDHQQWDTQREEVVSPKENRLGTFNIVSARFDVDDYRTILALAGHWRPLEIWL